MEHVVASVVVVVVVGCGGGDGGGGAAAAGDGAGCSATPVGYAFMAFVWSTGAGGGPVGISCLVFA